MSGCRYSSRPLLSARDVALLICADFAAECRRQGDFANHYRWRMVLHENRLKPVVDLQRDLFAGDLSSGVVA